MAKSNRDRLYETLDALKAGLGPFVLREYKMSFRVAHYLEEIELAYNLAAIPHHVYETKIMP